MPRKPAAPPLVSASGSPPGCQVSLTFLRLPDVKPPCQTSAGPSGPAFFLRPGLFLRSGLQIRKPGRGCLAGPARACRFNPSVFADCRFLLSLSVVMHRASRREARFVPGRQLLRLLLWSSGAIFGRPEKMGVSSCTTSDRRGICRSGSAKDGSGRRACATVPQGASPPLGTAAPEGCCSDAGAHHARRVTPGPGLDPGRVSRAPACRVRCQAWQGDRRSAVASLRGRHRPFRPSDRRRTSPAPPSACRDRLVVRSDDVRQYDAARRSAQVRSAFAA